MLYTSLIPLCKQLRVWECFTINIFTFCIFYNIPARSTLHFVFYIRNCAIYNLHLKFYILQFTVYIFLGCKIKFYFTLYTNLRLKLLCWNNFTFYILHFYICPTFIDIISHFTFSFGGVVCKTKCRSFYMLRFTFYILILVTHR